jgi:hypothetical protein
MCLRDFVLVVVLVLVLDDVPRAFFITPIPSPPFEDDDEEEDENECNAADGRFSAAC